MSTQAFVAVEYTDSSGVHRIGEQVEFPDDVAARLIEVGILAVEHRVVRASGTPAPVTPVSDGPLPEGVHEVGPVPVETVTLPDSPQDPQEGVKTPAPAKRRRGSPPKGS